MRKKSSGRMPLILMPFSREVAPEQMVMDRWGVFKVFERKRISSLLALPSTGGAANRILSQLSSAPAISEREALGESRTVRRQPSGIALIQLGSEVVSVLLLSFIFVFLLLS